MVRKQGSESVRTFRERVVSRSAPPTGTDSAQQPGRGAHDSPEPSSMRPPSSDVINAIQPLDLEPAPRSAPSALHLWAQIIWQRRSLLLLGAVVGLVLGSLYYVTAAPVYRSTAQ